MPAFGLNIKRNREVYASLFSFFFFLSFFIISCGGKISNENKELSSLEKGNTKKKYAKRLSYTVRENGYDVYIDLGDKSQILKLRRTGAIKGEVQIPVKRVIALSTTQVGPIVLLGKEKTLKAFSSLELLSSPLLRELVSQGDLEEVGVLQQLDVERVFQVGPEVLIVSYFPEKTKTMLSSLITLGMQVIEIPAYLESHPLGRAEWLYLYGMLYDELATAEKMFLEMERKYLALREKILKIKKNQPKVLIGMPYKGVWYVPRLDSYMGNFIKDAGAKMWNTHVGVGSVVVDFEEVLANSKDADKWMIFDNSVQTKTELKKIDSRYAFLKAFNNSQVYNNNRRVTHKANAYWESGMVEPEEILADIIQMCHGEKTLNREMKYILKLD